MIKCRILLPTKFLESVMKKIYSSFRMSHFGLYIIPMSYSMNKRVFLALQIYNPKNFIEND